MLASALSLCGADDGFVPLFDGKTLRGWEVCNGYATYQVEDGAIVGTTAEGSPNTFLCTKKEYGDFILEFEVKVDPALNSGVQIRSHRYPADTVVRVVENGKVVEHKQEAGRFYGYQVEISNEASATSGGIYDEARRGWLHDISSDPQARVAFKDNEWNRYRVAAVGDSIKTWVNGVPCADLVDPLDQSGFIGLQVHAIEGSRRLQVRWRNIRIKDQGRHVWRRVWDGKTLNGWTKRGGGAWTIEDGALHAVGTTADPRVGFLVSDRDFGDVTARIQLKILKGNSGFFLRADKETLAAYEVEIGADKRTGGFWETGGRNWVTGPEDNLAVKAGEWNEMTASLNGHRIVFHVNGMKTVDLANDTAGRIEGRLALQVHGKWDTDVWFKDIEVLEPERK